MKILIVGSGGREHALAWRLAQDDPRPELFIAPGNAGTAAVGTNLMIGAEDVPALVAWAVEQEPDLVVVGPEAPLCAGLADRLQAAEIEVFGPSQAAARLEGSKQFAKEVMQAAGVPTAAAAFFTAPEPAKAWIRAHGAPVVVKADGLAAGKGVFVCATVAEAEDAVEESLVRGAFGAAGRVVLVEECLAGEEASILALVDGERVVPLASSQDHKRALDADQGPNTGGMGAYSPAPVVTDALWPVIRTQVFDRTLAELRRRGITYRGLLYAGIMITQDGPKVLEFNCRFGDPETQAILPRWHGNFGETLRACARGCLDPAMIRWSDEPCVCIVMTAGGYPGTYRKGDVITGLDAAARLPGVTVLHAGTRLDGQGRVVTSGGRVLGVTAMGTDLRMAVDRAYAGVRAIHFEGAHYRTDIARRAL